jgi:hypothetical protein
LGTKNVLATNNGVYYIIVVTHDKLLGASKKLQATKIVTKYKLFKYKTIITEKTFSFMTFVSTKSYAINK